LGDNLVVRKWNLSGFWAFNAPSRAVAAAFAFFFSFYSLDNDDDDKDK
jgi:hypothetical protein